MASKSYPRTGYNTGFITGFEHERLVHPSMPEGLLGHPTDPGPVYADGTGTRLVKVRSSLVGYLRGSVWDSGATDIALPSLAANTSGQPRIDTVVLRLDRSDYTVTERVITGTPAASPVAPNLTFDFGSSGFYEFPLADVRVASGATTLASSTVTRRAWYVGNDGQVRCTPTTRPPHETGRSVFDTTAGFIVSTGSRWLVAAEDTGPLLMDMMAGYAYSQNTTWRRGGWAFGQLTFTRVPTGMNGGSPYTPARLPGGLWPPFTYQTNAQCPSLQITCTVAVLPDGYIRVNPGVDIPANRSIVLDALSHPIA